MGEMKRRKKTAWVDGPIYARLCTGHTACTVSFSPHNSVRKVLVDTFLLFRSSKIGQGQKSWQIHDSHLRCLIQPAFCCIW